MDGYDDRGIFAPCCRGRAPIYGVSGWAYCTVTRWSTCSAIPWTSLSSTATRNEICPWGWYSTSPNSPIWGKFTLFSFFLARQKKKNLFLLWERETVMDIGCTRCSWNNIERVGLFSLNQSAYIARLYNGNGEGKYCLRKQNSSFLSLSLSKWEYLVINWYRLRDDFENFEEILICTRFVTIWRKLNGRKIRWFFEIRIKRENNTPRAINLSLKIWIRLVWWG